MYQYFKGKFLIEGNILCTSLLFVRNYKIFKLQTNDIYHKAMSNHFSVEENYKVIGFKNIFHGDKK